MAPLRRSISSLSALATFEAASRLESFTLAADELGVTQAAVSRQIKLLETEINTSLFFRAHRRVVLTPVGAALASTVTGSFTRITEMIETIRQPLVPEAVAIGATLAFSHFWLLPRLTDFRAKHPEIKLKLIADDSQTDLRRDRLDIAIRFGKLPFQDGSSFANHADEVFPVCSPTLTRKLKFTPEMAELARLPLITSDPLDPSWLTWRSWAMKLGLGPTLGRASDLSRLRFNHYTDTIQAAINGEGVALGWSTLISDFLKEGRLVRIGQRSIIPEERHNVVIPAGRESSADTVVFANWIAARFNAET